MKRKEREKKDVSSRQKIIHFRVSEEEAEKINQMTIATKESLSNYLRRLILSENDDLKTGNNSEKFAKIIREFYNLKIAFSEINKRLNASINETNSDEILSVVSAWISKLDALDFRLFLMSSALGEVYKAEIGNSKKRHGVILKSVNLESFLDIVPDSLFVSLTGIVFGTPARISAKKSEAITRIDIISGKKPNQVYASVYYSGELPDGIQDGLKIHVTGKASVRTDPKSGKPLMIIESDQLKF